MVIINKSTTIVETFRTRSKLFFISFKKEIVYTVYSVLEEDSPQASLKFQNVVLFLVLLNDFFHSSTLLRNQKPDHEEK